MTIYASSVRRWVGGLHVGTPDNEVLRYVRSRFNVGAWEALPAGTRAAIEREALAEHRRNWELYRRVMSGSLGLKRRRKS